MHVTDYLKFRSEMSKEIQSQVIAEYGQPAPEEDVLAYIDYLLVQETGSAGFPGFILLEAKSGVSISHVGVGGGSESGINLGIFTWVYWLIEMGIIGWASIDSAYKKTKELFCEHCNAWVGQGDHIGGVHLETINLAVELTQRRDFAGLAKMLRHDTSLPSAEFYTRTCKTCNIFPFYLTGYAVSSGNKGQTQSKLIIAQVLNSSERHALISELGMPD
jgi:hypothetical protein